jgi:hypothetical protein
MMYLELFTLSYMGLEMLMLLLFALTDLDNLDLRLSVHLF